jgi:hypothetical protein
MRFKSQQALLVLSAAWLVVLSAAAASNAQVRRYEPSRPTVSPYLNLFRQNEFDQVLPNYHALVRPLQRQQEVNQQQQRILQQQSQALGQLQRNVAAVEQRQAEGPLVAPTGQGSWFNRPSNRATFLNSSRYYSQSNANRGRR